VARSPEGEYGIHVHYCIHFTPSSKGTLLTNLTNTLTHSSYVLLSHTHSDADVSSFCAIKGVKGANLFTKADVNGPQTRPTYKFLKETGVLAGDVFVVDKEGNVSPVKSEKDLVANIVALAKK
jgi:hypothetical protein